MDIHVGENIWNSIVEWDSGPWGFSELCGAVRVGGVIYLVFSFTDPAVSMDLLRAVLQPSINEEIQIVFNKYMKVKAH